MMSGGCGESTRSKGCGESIEAKASTRCCGAGEGNSHSESALPSCCAASPDEKKEADSIIDLPGFVRSQFRIAQMDCPTEERLIRDKLSSLASVGALEFNLLQRVLTVFHVPDGVDDIVAAIQSLDFTPEPLTDNARPLTPVPHQPLWPLVLAGLSAIGAEIAHFFALTNDWVVAALALVAIASCGLGTYKKGWIALKNRNLNINALMSIAVTGALLIGQWPEAAMVMVLFVIAELIEAKSIDRARHAIRKLLDLSPQQATVKSADGHWHTQDIRHIAMGSQVRVRPGERIALDGVIQDGQSSVNQAPITGESLPVDKTVGDAVYAGSLNEAGSFIYTTTAAADGTLLARIIHAVESAQGARAPTQRFVDQFAKVYTPVVFALALAVAVVPPLFSSGIWLEWIYRALVLLVVACPCALVISTPVTIVSGLAAAARQGILVKGGAFLEAGRHLRYLALDKTGTLTEGRPKQTDSIILSDEPNDFEVVAASLANRSDHPVSHAIASAFSGQFVKVEHFRALNGRGVAGSVAGHSYHLGNHRLIEELGLCSPELEVQLKGLEQQGKSVVLLTNEHKVLALFAVADTLRATSREAIQQLHELGVKTLMLSGDNQYTAQAIADGAGIDEVKSELLPEDKLAVIAALSGEHDKVGMVGDGINDAPALARADIGFAMGISGTDTAIETADVTLMDDDLRKIPRFIALSKQTATVLQQNIALAIGIKVVFLGLALVGQATLWMAVFADMGASLIVVANGLRMLEAPTERG